MRSVAFSAPFAPPVHAPQKAPQNPMPGKASPPRQGAVIVQEKSLILPRVAWNTSLSEWGRQLAKRMAQFDETNAAWFGPSQNWSLDWVQDSAWQGVGLLSQRVAGPKASATVARLDVSPMTLSPQGSGYEGRFSLVLDQQGSLSPEERALMLMYLSYPVQRMMADVLAGKG